MTFSKDTARREEADEAISSLMQFAKTELEPDIRDLLRRQEEPVWRRMLLVVYQKKDFGILGMLESRMPEADPIKTVAVELLRKLEKETKYR